ncbi:calcium-binding protein [Microvirga sp. 0TCS3.31]
MSVLTTTPNYPNELFRINSFFNGVGQGSVRYTSPTVIVLGTSDLNRIVLTGYGFQYDRSQENPWMGGTITSIALWDTSYDKKVAEISGLSIALSEVGPKFGVDMYSEIGLVSHLFSGSDVLIGSAIRDSFYGYDGNDTVTSGAGDDDVTPGSGNDVIDGGAGFDLVSYWNYDIAGGDEKSLGAVIDLRQGSVFDPWGGVDRLISIGGLEGTYYADTLTGNNLENTLFGLSGNDKISGLAATTSSPAGREAIPWMVEKASIRSRMWIMPGRAGSSQTLRRDGSGIRGGRPIPCSISSPFVEPAMPTLSPAHFAMRPSKAWAVTTSSPEGAARMPSPIRSTKPAAASAA